jgi:lipoprotein signal peptidase
MKERSYRGLLWTLAIVGFAMDQASKYLVFRWLYPGPDGYLQGEHDLLPGKFKFLAQFTPVRDSAAGSLSVLRTWGGELLPKVNHGALFGFGNEYAKVANMVFAGVSVVAAVAIIWWSTRKSTARDWSLCAALGLILAGTLGNLYDRVVFHGVRDFLYFYWFEWPVFNIADCCLVVGAGLLLLQALFVKPEPSGATAPSAPEAQQALGV